MTREGQDPTKTTHRDLGVRESWAVACAHVGHIVGLRCVTCDYDLWAVCIDLVKTKLKNGARVAVCTVLFCGARRAPRVPRDLWGTGVGQTE